MRTAIAPGQRQSNTRWQQAGEWRVEAVFPTGSTPVCRRTSCRHQRRGRRLPNPGSYTGTRHHSAIGYRDSLPEGSIAQWRPRSPPSALPVRGLQGSYETIRKWCRKFGQQYANQLRRRHPRPGDKWHLDEVFLTIRSMYRSGSYWIPGAQWVKFDITGCFSRLSPGDVTDAASLNKSLLI